ASPARALPRPADRRRAAADRPRRARRLSRPRLRLSKFQSVNTAPVTASRRERLRFRGEELLALELLLMNRAPVLVFGQRHPALDTDPHADFRWLVLTQQTLQQ